MHILTTELRAWPELLQDFTIWHWFGIVHPAEWVRFVSVSRLSFNYDFPKLKSTCSHPLLRQKASSTMQYRLINNEILLLKVESSVTTSQCCQYRGLTAELGYFLTLCHRQQIGCRYLLNQSPSMLFQLAYRKLGYLRPVRHGFESAWVAVGRFLIRLISQHQQHCLELEQVTKKAGSICTGLA